MRKRLVTIGTRATVAATISLAPVFLTAQAPTTPSGKTTKAYATPRTPWGDPDLQGIYTNKYEQGTPFERPNEFEGRRVEDVTGEELAAVLQKRQKDAIDRAPFAGGDPEGRLGGPLSWGDRFEITKGGRAWFVVDPPDGKIPPQTPEARQRLAGRGRGSSSFGNGPFNGPEDLSLYDRCITRGLPGSMLPAIYGDSYQIIQSPGYVAIRYEMIHETRVISLDTRSHVGKKVGLDMGDARGHWDGDTLVVETTNFRGRSIYRQGNPERFRLVERFTRVSRDKVEWAVTVDDPTTWTRPWTFAVPLTMNDNEPVLEYACHEGNYAVSHILSGARAGESGK
jgi:hypothetical protein